MSGLQVLVYLLPGIRAILMSANATQAMMRRARGLRDPSDERYYADIGSREKWVAIHVVAPLILETGQRQDRHNGTLPGISKGSREAAKTYRFNY